MLPPDVATPMSLVEPPVNLVEQPWQATFPARHLRQDYLSRRNSECVAAPGEG